MVRVDDSTMVYIIRKVPTHPHHVGCGQVGAPCIHHLDNLIIWDGWSHMILISRTHHHSFLIMVKHMVHEP